MPNCWCTNWVQLLLPPSPPPPQLYLSLQLSIASNRSFALSSHCCKSSIHVSISGLLALVKLCFALSYGIVPFSYLCVRYLSSTVPTHPYSSSFLSYSISVCLGNVDPNTFKCKSGSGSELAPNRIRIQGVKYRPEREKSVIQILPGKYLMLCFVIRVFI